MKCRVKKIELSRQKVFCHFWMFQKIEGGNHVHAGAHTNTVVPWGAQQLEINSTTSQPPPPPIYPPPNHCHTPLQASCHHHSCQDCQSNPPEHEALPSACDLCHDSNGRKVNGMQSYCMAEHSFQDIPLLQPPIHCLVVHPDKIHHLLHLLPSCDTPGASHLLRGFLDVAIIHLNLLKRSRDGIFLSKTHPGQANSQLETLH